MDVISGMYEGFSERTNWIRALWWLQNAIHHKLLMCQAQWNLDLLNMRRLERKTPEFWVRCDAGWPPPGRSQNVLSFCVLSRQITRASVWEYSLTTNCFQESYPPLIIDKVVRVKKFWLLEGRIIKMITCSPLSGLWTLDLPNIPKNEQNCSATLPPLTSYHWRLENCHTSIIQKSQFISNIVVFL